MNQQDDRLRARLREWRAIEPKAGFEAEVWRRIAAQPQLTWFQTLSLWLAAPPVWGRAAAVALAMAAGACLAQWSATATQPSPLFAQQTVAGSYLALLHGGVR